jgi:hypothetical protein
VKALWRYRGYVLASLWLPIEVACTLGPQHGRVAEVLRTMLLPVTGAWVWFLISFAYKSARQKPEPNWLAWLRRFADDHKVTKIAEQIGSIAFCIGVLAVVGPAKEEWTRIPAGSECLVSRTIYGMRDLDKAYDGLNKARKVNDEFGIAELAQQDVAISVPAGTQGLVIDTDFFKHFTFYRKVRILSEPYMGKALWIRRDALAAVPAPRPPALSNPYR